MKGTFSIPRRAAGMRAPPEAVPKTCGADVELGNFILDAGGSGGGDGDEPLAPRTGAAAARALLRQVDGTACRRGGAPRDWGRKFLAANGGCIYIDLDHLELCTPEVLSAFDHVAAWHAMLRLARDALDAANEELAGEGRIVALANNSDGRGSSYGSHLSFAVSSECFENVLDRRPHHLLFLATYLASAIVFSGAGKVGWENGLGTSAGNSDGPDAGGFQISQRADFLEVVRGKQTTYARPIVNARDESLAGERGDIRRLHCISFDSTLCHRSCLLKVGVTQIILALMEQEEVLVGGADLADDPVAAVHAWSRGPDLTATARTVSGRKATALEVQQRLCERAWRFVGAGRADGVVPRAMEIMRVWTATLDALERDPASLTGSIDWILKRAIIERALRRRGLAWCSPEAKHLDHLYSSLDTGEGLYWVCERGGAVERLVTDGRIERFVHQPPEETRAWTRAWLLRAAGGAVDHVDWDLIRLRLPGASGASRLRTLDMPHPLDLSRARVESLFRGARSLEELVEALDGLDGDGLDGPEETIPAQRDASPDRVLTPEASPSRSQNSYDHRHEESTQGFDSRYDDRRKEQGHDEHRTTPR